MAKKTRAKASGKRAAKAKKAGAVRVPINQAIAAAKSKAKPKGKRGAKVKGKPAGTSRPDGATTIALAKMRAFPRPRKNKAKPAQAKGKPAADVAAEAPGEVFERLRLPKPVRVEKSLKLIELDDRNTRALGHSDEKIDDMAESLRTLGQLQPIGLVEDTRARCYRVVFGHLRVLGARKAKLDRLDAMVWQSLSEEQFATAQAVENLIRNEPTPLDWAAAIDRLSEGRASRMEMTDVDVKNIAASLRLDEREVRKYGKLTRLPADGDAARLLAEHRLTINQAETIATLADPKLQDECADLAARGKDGAGGWSEYATRRWVVNNRLNLRGVPWELGVEFAGKPPCTTCPHNGKNNPTLFEGMGGNGVDAKHGIGESDAGMCLNAACFKAKTRSATLVLSSITKRAEAKLVPVMVSAAKAAKKSPDESKPVSLTARTLQDQNLLPEGLKTSTVVHQVKKAVEPALMKKGVTVKGEVATGEPLNGIPGPDLTGKAGRGKVQADPREVAKQRCDDAREKWEDDLKLSAEKALCEVPGRRSLLLAFVETEMYGSRLSTSFGTAGGNARVATVLGSPDVKQTLGLFKSPSIDGIAEIEGGMEPGWDSDQPIGDALCEVLHDMDVGVLRALVEAMGVQIPPKPELATFLKEIGLEQEKPKAEKGGKRKGKKKSGDDDAAADEAAAQAERQQEEFEQAMGGEGSDE